MKSALDSIISVRKLSKTHRAGCATRRVWVGKSFSTSKSLATEVLMRNRTTLMIAIAAIGCSKDAPKSETTTASASASAIASAVPSVTAAPSASASAEPEAHHECPPHSAGVGSFSKPCEAKGAERLMTVKVTKVGDKGPSFNIKNIGKTTIIYGKIAVYFYDKNGKQLDVKDESETPPKTKPYHTCSGNFFQGVMKPGESAVLTFSCVPKKVIPEGTVTTEGEMQMVGFADATEKKVDFYWRNKDLTPDARPKGGIK